MGTLDTAPFILGAGATARMTFDGEHRPARRSVGRLAAPRQSPAAPEGPREWDEAARLLRALGR
jgi:hypothetical protein